MRQLVGQLCVICGKKIGSIVDGRFCSECGCPIHGKCAQPGATADETVRCPVCGAQKADMEREQALHHRDAEETRWIAKQHLMGCTVTICSLLVLFGLARLLFRLASINAREAGEVTSAALVGEVVDAGFPALMGGVVLVSTFVYALVKSARVKRLNKNH